MSVDTTCQVLLHHLLDDLEHLDHHVPDFRWYAARCLEAALEDDDLPLLVECAWEEFRTTLETRCQEFQLSWQEAVEELGYDLIGEIADQHTPIWTSVIQALYFLYSPELEEAFNNAGLYEKLPENYQQVSICLYLEQQLQRRAQKYPIEGADTARPPS